MGSSFSIVNDTKKPVWVRQMHFERGVEDQEHLIGSSIFSQSPQHQYQHSFCPEVGELLEAEQFSEAELAKVLAVSKELLKSEEEGEELLQTTLSIASRKWSRANTSSSVAPCRWRGRSRFCLMITKSVIATAPQRLSETGTGTTWSQLFLKTDLYSAETATTKNSFARNRPIALFDL